MQRQTVGIRAKAECGELARQPIAEEGKKAAGIAQRGVVDLGKLCGQRADRAAVAQDLRPVGDQDADEAADAHRRAVAGLVLPGGQKRARRLQPPVDHSNEDVVFRLEMMVEIAARNADRRRDIGKGGVLEPLLVEQPVRLADDLVAGRARHSPTPFLCCRPDREVIPPRTIVLMLI